MKFRGGDKTKSIFLALLAGIVAGALVPPAQAAGPGKFREKILWSFDISTGGQEPRDTLIEVHGKLYGTASNGGANRGGAVFSLDPNTRIEKVLHSFCAPGCKGDGEQPKGGLIHVNGMLYGTTRAGGAHGDGSVFSIDPKTRIETVVHSFCHETECADGAAPDAGLINVKGILYGATEGGGPECNTSSFVCGTIFSFNPQTGVYKLLHGFKGLANGNHPETNLLNWKGKLYGTTAYGGNNNCGSIYGCGTLFSVDPKTGAETVLYTFCSQPNCADGYVPYSALINVNGIFYGTTSTGGASPAGPYSGTLYAFDPGTGAVKALYSFCSQPVCADGSMPYGNLIVIGRRPYGTTDLGGDGWGTVFSIDPSTGAEKVIYAFQKSMDGHMPNTGLTYVDRTIYGTTLHGGTHGNNGTVFALTK